jgi:two-component system cell cycle response regulator DivK
MSTILVIDDNAANRTLVSLLLRNVGYTVLAAVDAEAGVALARTALPDCILMDMQLPGRDGLAATALLKGDKATADIPVIALNELALKAKPLRYREMYAVIDRQLGRGTKGTVRRNLA